MDNTTKNTNDHAVKLHLEEADVLKKQWYSYVLDTLTDLHKQVQNNTLQVQRERERVYKSLVELKDEITKAIGISNKSTAEELKQLESKLNEFIYKVEHQVDVFSSQKDAVEEHTRLDDRIDELRGYIDEKATHFMDKDDLKEAMKDLTTEQQTMKILVTSLKTRIGVYITIIGLGITAFVTTIAGGILVLIKDISIIEAIKAWWT